MNILCVFVLVTIFVLWFAGIRSSIGILFLLLIYVVFPNKVMGIILMKRGPLKSLGAHRKNTPWMEQTTEIKIF